MTSEISLCVGKNKNNKSAIRVDISIILASRSQQDIEVLNVFKFKNSLLWNLEKLLSEEAKAGISYCVTRESRLSWLSGGSLDATGASKAVHAGVALFA